MCKGSNTTSNASTTSAAPQATSAYSDVLNKAQGVAATPYQAYTGELTAPINAQQQTGISGINAAAGQAQPGLAAANNQAIASSAPITGQTIQNYQNPYTQQVVNATEAQINQQNQQQQSQLLGNQISQGALGGNRVGVAQANLGAQQSLANNSTLAGLYSNSYQQALAAAQNQQQTGLAGANAQANFAVQGQNAALTGAGAQLGAGTVQQQTQQQIDSANQAAYNQQQAYPFQTTQWLAGIDTGVAPGLGSSSTGQTTAPPPNQTAQYLGAGLTAASFLASGGAVNRGVGGAVQHFDGGGVAKSPWASAPTWVPQIGMGSAAPHAGSAPSAANTTTPAFDYSKIISANNKDSNGLLSGPSYGGGNVLTDAYGGSSSNPLPGLDASDYGAGFARGGIASARFADGGATFRERYPQEIWPSPDQNKEGVPMWPRKEGDGPNDIPSWQREQEASRLGSALRKRQHFADGGAPDDPGVGAAVWNPDEPFRMADQKAVEDWRSNNPIPSLGTPPVAQNDDDAPLPPEVAQGASKPSAGVGVADAQPMAFAPGQPTSSPQSLAPTATAPTTAPDNSGGGLGLLNLSHNARSGLLAAGLGMLASRSPNFGNAIGEGGLAGAAAYGAGEERDRKVAAEAAKLSKEAAQHAEEMKLKTDTQKETARHNKRTEDISEDKAPSGYQRKDDGTLVFEKGGPHDPDVIAAETNARTKKGTELDDDTVDAIAQRVAQGDTRAVIGLGRNPAGIAQIQKRVAEIFKEQGLDHEAGAKAILGNIADQAGRMTAERTQAGIAAKLAVYGRNVDNAIGVATKASEEANRTNFTPVNVAINAFKAKTGDPKIVALGQALTTLTNEYARAVGGGHGTVHDKEQAEQHLNQAQSHEQLLAIMNVMRKEIEMTKKSMPEAREEMRELYSRPSSEKGNLGTTAAPPIVGGATTFTPPSGALARQFNGKTYYYDPNTKQPYPGQ